MTDASGMPVRHGPGRTAAGREEARPGAPEERGALARNAAHLVMGQAATTVLAVLLSAALGRSLGAAEFGLYFLFTAMATFAFVVVEWGQSQYVIREIARQPGRAGSLLGSAVALRIGGTAAAAGLTYLATWLLGYDARSRGLATLLLVTLLPFFLSQAYGAVFRRRERMDLDAVVSVVNKGLTLLLSVGALLAGGGLLGVILAQGAAGLGALCVAVALGGRRLGVRAGRVARDVARELVVGGTPIVAMSLAISAQAYLDAVVLSKLAPEQAVGWYGAAKNVLGTLIAPATILGSAAFPRLSRAVVDPRAFGSELKAAMRPLLLLAALAGVGTYVFAEPAVAIIYGRERFGPASDILRAFTPGLFLLFVDILLGAAIVASGRSAALAAAKVVNVAVTTGLDFVLVPLFQARSGNGGMGVVVAFAASEIIMFGAALAILPRAALSASLFLDFGRALAAGGGALLLVFLLPPVGPILGLAIAVVSFGILAVALRLVGRADVEALVDLVRRRAGGRAGGDP